MRVVVVSNNEWNRCFSLSRPHSYINSTLFHFEPAAVRDVSPTITGSSQQCEHSRNVQISPMSVTYHSPDIQTRIRQWRESDSEAIRELYMESMLQGREC